MRLTTILDLVGVLAIIAGLGMFVAQFSLPGAVAASGACLIALSWSMDRKRGGE